MADIKVVRMEIKILPQHLRDAGVAVAANKFLAMVLDKIPQEEVDEAMLEMIAYGELRGCNLAKQEYLESLVSTPEDK